jgi:hypothetical protein
MKLTTKKPLLLLTLTIALGLAACASNLPLQRTQISQLSQETTLDEANKIIADSKLQVSHTFSSNGGVFNAKHYNLQTGTNNQMSMVCSPVCFPIFIPVPVLTPYVIITREDSNKVFANGTLEELSKSNNITISQIMPDLKNSLEKETSKK